MGYLKMLALASVLYGTAGACASAGDMPAPAGPLSQETEVYVMNNNWADVTIYADRGSSRIRLGMVPSMSAEKLEIPAWVASSPQGVSFVVSPIGTRAVHTTAPISIHPGQTVEFRVENHLAISSILVR